MRERRSGAYEVLLESVRAGSHRVVHLPVVERGVEGFVGRHELNKDLDAFDDITFTTVGDREGRQRVSCRLKLREMESWRRTRAPGFHPSRALPTLRHNRAS